MKYSHFIESTLCIERVAVFCGPLAPLAARTWKQNSWLQQTRKCCWKERPGRAPSALPLRSGAPASQQFPSPAARPPPPAPHACPGPPCPRILPGCGSRGLIPPTGPSGKLQRSRAQLPRRKPVFSLWNATLDSDTSGMCPSVLWDLHSEESSAKAGISPNAALSRPTEGATFTPRALASSRTYAPTRPGGRARISSGRFRGEPGTKQPHWAALFGFTDTVERSEIKPTSSSRAGGHLHRGDVHLMEKCTEFRTVTFSTLGHVIYSVVFMFPNYNLCLFVRLQKLPLELSVLIKYQLFFKPIYILMNTSLRRVT